MAPHTALATASRDSHLALRRVERQQVLIERLHAARGARLQLEELAFDLHVSRRTLARDVERLRYSGVPILTHRGRGGGVSVPSPVAVAPITFDLPEVAALMSSLAVVGTTISSSATSAMRKLTGALQADPPVPPRTGGWTSPRA
ncbi:MAG TPA: HTH domain-containing protein [Propionibacteriaceae bacterium]|jgi:predicted DNA-binding transcriptional regulator YafY